jgi:hypothetical protein
MAKQDFFAHITTVKLLLLQILIKVLIQASEPQSDAGKSFFALIMSAVARNFVRGHYADWYRQRKRSPILANVR